MHLVAVAIAGVSAVVSSVPSVSAVSAVVAVTVAGIAVVAVIATILFFSHQVGDGGVGSILGQHRQHQADQQNLEMIKIFVTTNIMNSVPGMSVETNEQIKWKLTASFIIILNAKFSYRSNCRMKSASNSRFFYTQQHRRWHFRPPKLFTNENRHTKDIS